MAWMKRRGQATPSPAPVPPVPMYNPNQHSKQENHWQQHDPNWYGHLPQPPKQEQQHYWQQPYNSPQSNQNAPNQDPQFTQLAQNAYYPNADYQLSNHTYQQNTQYFTQPNVPEQPARNVEGDTWNWGWGEEDNSNVQTPQNSNTNLNRNLTESLKNEESWNWSVEEAQSTSSLNYPTKPEPILQSLDGYGSFAGAANNKLDDLQTSSLPIDHNSSVKREKSDHLTPQWSTESQVSQESSDDVLQTSESDKILSRSSTISQSPISGHDGNADLQVKQENLQHLPKNQELQIFTHENKEILANVKEDVQENKVKSPSPIVNPPPMLPPPPHSDDLKNPYKRTTGLSHKAANLLRSSNATPPGKSQFYHLPPFNQSVNLETLPDNSEQPDSLPLQSLPRKITPEKNLMYPEKNTALYPEKNTGIYPEKNTGIYLEKNTGIYPEKNTGIYPEKNTGSYLENNEIAPINERNQYLETGQLSDESTNHMDTLPPPGLRRMVLGQIETNFQVNANENVDEPPPPGLSRMVLGQTETSNVGGSPVGFHRMIPGESSSPESNSRYQPIDYQDEHRREDYEVELNQLGTRSQTRSATIGADTPPVDNSSQSNRSETIGGVVGVDNLKQDSKSENRRESIEGQPQDDINTIVNAVRDLTVGTDNVTNDQIRRRSREQSTDSEDVADVTDSKGRRYKDDKRDKPKNRDRYSPDYKDKKYDRKKSRRYDEDTDYYSDKERDRRKNDRDRREDYDRKYGSLRKEKDRRKKDYPIREYDRRDYDRRDAPREYDRRDGRGGYYDRYDYDDSTRSRPSSRSDSMHESYRERVNDHRRYRDRGDRDRRHRDPYNPYMQGFAYDPYNQYYQQYQYQYYENLRRTNPQAYAEWYRKYFQNTVANSSSFGAEDRASVHSGRSSNEDLKDRYMRQSYYSHTSLPHMGSYYRESHSISGQYGMDESSYSRPFDATDASIALDETTTQPQRLTPAKFTTAHVKASIDSGRLIKILPHYPMDGQSATVELVNLQSVLSYDSEIKELVEFPGPLAKGVTHKKTIIEYCEMKIREATYSEAIVDPESYVLMWELMILLIRQNGMVVGTDIAELLMKDRNLELSQRPSSVLSNTSSAIIDLQLDSNNVQKSESVNSATSIREEIVTNKFREYLIYGSGKEALEWAMKHGLWGHALFLASKLDKRTYANVMMRFANGLTMNDPLQTLYQLLSGRLPASVTCVSDEKWGDWRPHLAMILSNTTSGPELNRKAVTTLADTLLNRGSLYAAHFCYLMAEVGFSCYGTENAKLVLLGADHNKSFAQFATNEAIHLTEIYEYAQSLNDSEFTIPEFQSYKYLLATRLSDRGLLEKSLAYLERVALSIVRNPTVAQIGVVDLVYRLADKLKYNDPIGDADESGDVDLNVSRPDNSWLKDLKVVLNNFNMGFITHESQRSPDVDVYQQQVAYDQQVNKQQDAWQQQHGEYHNEQQWPPVEYVDQKQVEQQPYEHPPAQNAYGVEYQEQQQYWPNPQQWTDTQQNATEPYNQQENQIEAHQQQNDYWNNAHTEPDEVEKRPDEDVQRPQISMPNQSKGSFNNENVTDTQVKKESPMKQKPSVKSTHETSTGWFGGIWNRLALRPKNQMKLPDDKNPTIVWDSDKKKWVNTEEDGNEVAADLKPPPKMAEMNVLPAGSGENFQVSAPINLVYDPGQINMAEAPQDAPKPPQPNMFKLQRGRNLKKSYVDVFNPGGKSAPALIPGNEFTASTGTNLNFFVPQAVNDPNAPTDFLTPSNEPMMYQPQ